MVATVPSVIGNRADLRCGHALCQALPDWHCEEFLGFDLGVGELVVVDPDVVESSNRARFAGATPEDARRAIPKVQVIARYALTHNPDVQVRALRLDVNSHAAVGALKTCDILVGCTDTLVSRPVLNALAVRYVIPLIDTGAEVEIGGGTLRTFAVRSTPVLPKSSCLVCDGFVTGDGVHAEVRAPRSGYVPGVAAASVAPLNALASSLACLDVLRLVHGLLGGVPAATFSAYSGRSGELRRCAMGGAACVVCENLFGRGDAPSPRMVHGQRAGLTDAE